MVDVAHDAKSVGMRIKLLRTASGLSQPQLALGIEQAARRQQATTRRRIALPDRGTLKTQISFWENGRRMPSDFYRPLIADALGVPQSELFDQPPTRPPLDGPAEELRHRIAAAGAVDAGTLELLDAQTHQLRLMDRRLGGREVLGQLRSHVETVHGLFTHAVAPGQRRPLASILADAATLAGWQALDTGATAEAWQHFETAKAAAREADSPALLAHAMGEQAYALLDLGRAADALDVIQAARAASRAAAPPLLSCWLTAAEAELAAATGDAGACRRTLDLADRALPADCTDPELPYLLLAPAHLTRWRGSTLARLGDTDAIEHLYAALDGMGNTNTLRGEAGLRCDLVAAFTARGDLDQAATEAATARELATRAGSVRLRRRLDQLAAA